MDFFKGIRIKEGWIHANHVSFSIRLQLYTTFCWPVALNPNNNINICGWKEENYALLLWDIVSPAIIKPRKLLSKKKKKNLF